MRGFDNNHLERYQSEVQERWGNTDAYQEYAEKTKNYGKSKWSSLAADLDHIFSEFALCMKNDIAPDSEEPQNLVAKLQACISENCYTCTTEILSGLGQMYPADERFKHNIDRYAEGTAAYASKAIAHYCKVSAPE